MIEVPTWLFITTCILSIIFIVAFAFVAIVSNMIPEKTQDFKNHIVDDEMIDKIHSGYYEKKEPFSQTVPMHPVHTFEYDEDLNSIKHKS